MVNSDCSSLVRQNALSSFSVANMSNVTSLIKEKVASPFIPHFSWKIEFPLFDGTHPRVWIWKCQEYFKIYRVSFDQQLALAIMSLGVKGALWYQATRSGKEFVHWSDLVRGIEAESTLFGHAMSIVLHSVVGKFVEIYCEGMGKLSLADRATIANISSEYGTTMGFFPVDCVTLQYLKLTGRSDDTMTMIETYVRANKMFVDYNEPQTERAETFYLELNVADVELCIPGQQIPYKRFHLIEMKADWLACRENKVGLKNFKVPKGSQDKVIKLDFHVYPVDLKNNSVVVSAIIWCTNTSILSIMLWTGLVAKKACELGLHVKPWINISLASDSGVDTNCLPKRGLQEFLNKQGFHIVGYGCTACIGNSGNLDEFVSDANSENDIVTVAILSGNRNVRGVLIL